MSVTPAQPSEAQASVEGIDAFVQKNLPWNATCLAVENAMFLVAIAFVNSTTVLPTFVIQLGGSALLVGLVGTFQTAGWLLPQLVSAGLCAGKARVRPYLLGPLYFGRPAFLVVAALTLVLGTRQPWLLLAALYLAIAVFFASDGLATVPWYELIGKSIPATWRGRMLGTAQIIGGLGGMAVGGFVAWTLSQPDLPFPTNYAVLFGLSGAIFCASIGPFFLLREPVVDTRSSRTAAAERPSARQFLSQLLPIFRHDRNFVRLVAVRLLFGVVTATFPFYVLFAGREFSMGRELVGLFLSAQVFGGLVGGLAIGYVADRLGTKPVVQLAAVVGAAVPAVGLAMLAAREVAAGFLLYPCVLLFALMGAIGWANLMGAINYLLEMVPPERRSTYVGLFNTIAGALLVVPPLAGWFLEATSFTALFGVTILAGALCLLVSLGLRKPHRQG